MTPLPILELACSGHSAGPIACVCPRCQRARYVLLTAGLLLIGGCSRQTQVAPANRQLLESLRTAVSAQRADWLEANSKIIDERRASGGMTDTEYEAIEKIVADARAGRWAEADARVTKLAAGQRVTDEDRARLKSQRPAPRP